MPGFERKIDDHWVIVLDGQSHAVEMRPVEGGHDIIYGDKSYKVRSQWQFGQPLFRGTVNDERVCIQVERRNLIYRLFHWGSQVDIMVLTARAAELLSAMPVKAPPDTSQFLLSPMPGLLKQLTVAEGNEVTIGQDLAVVEAMKMENVLRAERNGKVQEIMAGVGETLAVDQPIMKFE